MAHWAPRSLAEPVLLRPLPMRPGRSRTATGASPFGLTRRLYSGVFYADQAAVPDGGQITLRDDPFPARHIRDQDPRRFGRVPARRFRGARALEPGPRRYPRP